jgi:hypothetical protein
MADDCLLRLVGSISWTPEFVLKRYVLSGIQDAPQEPLIADSIDFVVNQVHFSKPRTLFSSYRPTFCIFSFFSLHILAVRLEELVLRLRRFPGLGPDVSAIPFGKLSTGNRRY